MMLKFVDRFVQIYSNMSTIASNPVFRISDNRISDTNEAVQPQMMARCLKFQINEVKGL